MYIWQNLRQIKMILTEIKRTPLAPLEAQLPFGALARLPDGPFLIRRIHFTIIISTTTPLS